MREKIEKELGDIYVITYLKNVTKLLKEVKDIDIVFLMDIEETC